MAFNGFTKDTIQFLHDLRDNNYKEWFEANREVYEKVLLNPFRELVTELTPAMHNIDPQFEFRPHRVLSRIYRDVRFSADKSPYKTHMWMSFQQPVKNWECYPGFFFELGLDGYFMGMGLFQPKKKNMDDLRDRIAYDAEEFQKQTEPILKNGYQIGGDLYKRPLKNDLPEYFQQWVQRRSIYVYRKKPINEVLFSADFASFIRNEYESLTWLYNFLKDE